MDIALSKSGALRSKYRQNKTHFFDSFSEEVFKQTYCFDQEANINERHFKVASNLASVESPDKRDYWVNAFLELLEDFKFVPHPSTWLNEGRWQDEMAEDVDTKASPQLSPELERLMAKTVTSHD